MKPQGALCQFSMVLPDFVMCSNYLYCLSGIFTGEKIDKFYISLAFDKLKTNHHSTAHLEGY